MCVILYYIYIYCIYYILYCEYNERTGSRGAQHFPAISDRNKINMQAHTEPHFLWLHFDQSYIYYNMYLILYHILWISCMYPSLSLCAMDLRSPPSTHSTNVNMCWFIQWCEIGFGVLTNFIAILILYVYIVFIFFWIEYCAECSAETIHSGNIDRATGSIIIYTYIFCALRENPVEAIASEWY